MACLPHNFIQSEVSIHPTCNNLICLGTGLNVGGKLVLQQCFERIFFCRSFTNERLETKAAPSLFFSIRKPQNRKKKVKLSSNLRYVFFFFSKMFCTCEINDFGVIKHLVPAALQKGNNPFIKLLRCAILCNNKVLLDASKPDSSQNLRCKYSLLQ